MNRSQAQQIERYVYEVLPAQEHRKRKASIARAVIGLVQSAALSIQAMGHGMAQALALDDKHGIKQVDRLLSNPKFKLERLFGPWIRQSLGESKEVLVALDWTDYDRDKHSTLSLGLVAHKGRAWPLMFKTVEKASLKGKRNYYEDLLLTQFAQHISEGVRVTVSADRGFADQKFLAFMEKLGFDYIVRIASSTYIYSEPNTARVASRWLRPGGRSFSLKDAYMTRDFAPIGMFVSVKKKEMKEPWFIVSSRKDLSSTQILSMYARRFTIEEMFRDEKDPHFGMGLSQTRIRSIHRRDRILFLAALARGILTTLGAAGESLGYDRLLKSNTVKKRTQSLYRQGLLLFGKMENWDAKRKRPLLNQLQKLLRHSPFYSQILGDLIV